MGETGARSRLPRRVALLVGLAAVVPAAVVGALFLRAIEAEERSLAAEREALAQSVAQRVDEALQDPLQRLAAISSAPGFDLGDPDPGPETSALHAVWLASRRFESVSLVELGGVELSREPSGSPAAPLSALQGLSASRPVVTSAVSGPAGLRVLLATPLGPEGASTVWAVGCVDPSRPEWTALLRLDPERPGLAVSLVDASGVSLISRGAGPDGAVESIQASAPVRVAGWTLTLSQSREQALGPSLKLRRRLLEVVPLLLALALAFAWGAARSITQPLATLVEAARRIAQGEIDRPVPDVGRDEIGQLGEALETMRGALHRSFEQVSRTNEELEARVAERTREITSLYEQLRERDAWRRRVLQRALSAQEEERKRISRELHDETSQALAALVLSMDVERAASGPPAPGRPDLKALANHALDGLRNAMFDLRPSALDDLGLFAAIRGFAARRLGPAGVSVHCEFEEPDRRLPPEIETAVFRIVQEALNNVARHAEADSVLIQIAPRGSGLRLEIEDDGKGFEPSSVAKPGPDGRGLGLLGLRERVELLGGEVSVESSPGSGTRVVVDVPLPDLASPWPSAPASEPARS